MRLYDVVRSAHLERALELAPSTFLYARANYDFDADIIARHPEHVVLFQATALGSAVWLLRHPPRVLEVNEPLARPAIRRTALGIAAVRLRRLLGGQRTRCVTYAIENLDPDQPATPRSPRAWASYVVDGLFSQFVARHIDRVVYGSAQSRELYGRVRPLRSGARSGLIWALPAPADDAAACAKADEVVFVGAFTERKGIRQLLEVWPQVAETHPAWRLRLVGKGALTDCVESFGENRDEVTVEIDPSRERIRSILAKARVLVLFSQRTERWREQIGLPICEGLAYGCTIVASTETGLADWLAGHGHAVAPAGLGSQALAAALNRAVDGPLPVDQVLGSLPQRDGRLAADDWLMA